MNITIISVGKIKEKYFIHACDEYIKRLSKFVKLKMEHVDDEKIPENVSVKEEEILRKKEGLKILNKIPKSAYVITLEIDGKNMDSIQFADKISQIENISSHICFIIGGSIGLSDDVKARSDFALSFSKMTFPHQLFRVILLEQIYRAYKINNNERYHK